MTEARLAPHPEPRPPLFVYGTLVLPEVRRTLLGRFPATAPAALPGYRAVTLPGRVYPGLKPGPGVVRGELLTDLGDAEWRLLDAFEDPGYLLAPVPALPVPGLAYLWPGEEDGGEWHRGEFTLLYLSSYLNRCSSWLARYRSSSDTS